jgi:hypothetical protein
VSVNAIAIAIATPPRLGVTCHCQPQWENF